MSSLRCCAEDSESLRSETRAEHLASNSIDASSMEEMVDSRFDRAEISLIESDDTAKGEILGLPALLAFGENILSKPSLPATLVNFHRYIELSAKKANSRTGES